jgi:hypothetical protein
MSKKAAPATRTLPLREAQQALDKLVVEVSQSNRRVLIALNDASMAALVSQADLRRLQQLDEERSDALQVLEDSWAAFKDVDPEEVEREVAQAVAEARAEIRAERKLAIQALAAIQVAFKDIGPDEVQREVADAVERARAEYRSETERAAAQE